MYIIFFRSIIIFVLLLVIVRLMGKRQIGEMQPFELVVTLIIADLATIPMTDLSIPLIYGIVGIFTLFILHQILSFIDRKCKPLSNLISGTPTIVVTPQGIDFDKMRNQNLSVDDLLESLRGAGYASVDEVAFAIFETNGKLSVVPKRAGSSEAPAALPLVVIQQGEIQEDILTQHDLTPQELKKACTQNGYKTLKDVEIAMLDTNGKLFIQQKNKGYETFETQLKAFHA